MDDEQLLRDAEARIEARRRALPEIPRADPAGSVERLPLPAMTTCGACGTRGTWGGRSCPQCALRARVEADNHLPKERALYFSGVPQRYRASPEWLAEPWPEAHPIKRLDSDTFAEAWSSGNGPWCLIFSGVNGSGKSMRAAEMLCRFWRLGYRPLRWQTSSSLYPMWVSDPAVAAEDAQSGYGEERRLAYAFEHQAVLVVDELGASENWGLMARLLELRHGQELPTIITTHRPVSRKTKESVGYPGASVEDAAPEIYSRFRVGWIAQWQRKSWR